MYYYDCHLKTIFSAQVQCNPPKRNKKTNFTQSDIGKIQFNPEDLRFLQDQISFNFALVNHKQFRLPAYRYCRFANEEDLDNLNNTKCYNRKKLYNKVSGYKSTSKSFPTLPSSIANVARMRLGVEDRHYCSKLDECTPWLSKNFPQSVQRNMTLLQNNNSFGDKIYASIEVDYQDKFVLTQETDRQVGYIPQRFVAYGTVALPKVDKKEIWTVGFVQAVVNDSGRCQIFQKYCNQDTGEETM